MKIIIETCNNGAIVTDAENNTRTVFQYDEESKRGLQALLWLTMDLLDGSSRYDRERIYIEIRHGDKFLHKNKKDLIDCEICKAGKE